MIKKMFEALGMSIAGLSVLSAAIYGFVAGVDRLRNILSMQDIMVLCAVSAVLLIAYVIYHLREGTI